MRRALAVLLGVMTLAGPAAADRPGARPILHEPIPANAREDLSLQVSLDGDLPAAISTPRGLLSAPDPAETPAAGQSPYGPGQKSDVPDTRFTPDLNTAKPDVRPYDDPFTPSTAPFKRLSAFDAVDASYTLRVRDGHTSPLAVSSVPSPDPSEDRFFANMVVDLVKGVGVRIPSVMAGARVLHARAGVGTQDIRVDLVHDGADNWFVLGGETAHARLVMEIAAPHAAFGGDFGNPSWAELLPVAPLPPNVKKSADAVAAQLGVSRRQSPREDLGKLVAYFRSFTDSEDGPKASADIYLDLALSKKGVCRHRSFAFMVTALSLGLPTRMVVNEAHAWVEVHDGRLWRRIDLGGAGRMEHDPLSSNVPHDAPPDPFPWPPGANRGEDADRARRAPGAASSAGAPSSSSSASPLSSASPTSSGSSGNGGFSPNGAGSSSNVPPGFGGNGANGPMSSGGMSSGRSRGNVDDRPFATVSLSLVGTDAHRGAPLHVRGDVAAEGEPCGHVSVELVLRSRRGELVVGQLATDPRGAYDGSLVLPADMPLGDYDLVARTYGDARCGLGVSK